MSIQTFSVAIMELLDIMETADTMSEFRQRMADLEESVFGEVTVCKPDEKKPQMKVVIDVGPIIGSIPEVSYSLN